MEQRALRGVMQEGRWRLIYCGVGWLSARGRATIYGNERVYLLCWPLTVGSGLGRAQGGRVFGEPTELWRCWLRAGRLWGSVCSWPLLLLQWWFWRSGGCLAHERRRLTLVVVAGLLSQLVALWGSIGLRVPRVIRWFVGRSVQEGSLRVEALPSVGSLVTFSGTRLLLRLMRSQLPWLLLWIWGEIPGVGALQWWGQHRRAQLRRALVRGALLSPPDVATQLLVAGVLRFLWELMVRSWSLLRGYRRWRGDR